MDLRLKKQLSALYQTILQLESEEECAAFFRDLCTLKELEDMASRWEVAKLIDCHVPYREIAEKTGASTATVTRVAQWLNNGEGGYKLALKKGQKKA